MTTKHTPGPWTYEGCEIVTKIGAWPVAATNEAGIKQPERLANARLIAAAPELAEALRGLFENCAIVHNRWGDGCNQKEADAVIARARALLARIDGE